MKKKNTKIVFNVTKRKLPNDCYKYGWSENHYILNPQCGDSYMSKDFTIVVSKIFNNELIYYKNGIRKRIPLNEFSDMIMSLNSYFSFAAMDKKSLTKDLKRRDELSNPM